MRRCPRCSKDLETPLGCLECGAVLPLGDDLDRSGPFEVLGLPPGYEIDPQDLRRRLLRFSRLVHPDFFASASPEEKHRAEHAAAVLNASFARLADGPDRADFLVRNLGGPDETAERTMPKEFLMQVLDWNETLEAARGGTVGADHLEGLRRELEARRAEALLAISKLLVPLPPAGSPGLAEVRQRLNAVRYVDRALAEIEALRLSRAEAR